MKVLHLHNIAGVSSLLVQGLRSVGVETDLLVRKRSRFAFPHETVTDLSPRNHLLFCLRKGRKYDIVHIHGLQYLKQFNVDVLLQKLVNRRVVIHLHGSELRLNHQRIRVKALLKTFKPILLSTPDLLKYCNNGIYLPNPIDPMFKPLRIEKHGTLYFRHWYEPEDAAWRTWNELNLPSPLYIPQEPIPHKNMPKFLNRFEYFLDRFTIPSLSKTVLEALACGCQAVDWRGKFVNPSILKKHKLEEATKKLLEIYGRIRR